MSALTVGAHLGWRIAGLEAQRSGAGTIGVDHLLVGLLSLEKALEPAAGISPDQRDAVLAEQQGLSRILADCDIDAATLRRAVRRQIPPGDAAPEGTVHRDAACRAMFERASVLARDLGNVPCGPLHLLTALVEAPSAALYAALPAITTGLPGPLERLHLRVRAAITPTRPAWKTEPVPPSLPSPDLHPLPLGEGRGEAAQTGECPQDKGAPLGPRGPMVGHRGEGFATPPLALLRYGRDLTAEAEAGRLPPVVGRRDEMLQVVRVLRRRTKNSPVLVGEAGVGKTTVVEGLARRIAEGSTLPGRRIVALSLASVVAGTSYRGQFEERLEEILAELRKRRDVILFLDELHTIVGAGDADGSLDAANILKPALARGEIACIGATTLDEYRRHIESDPALERRFQPVLVSEPSPAEAREMLAGLRADLEQHHGVSIDADALDAGVELTVRYVTARRLPDKAVDALDEACARTAVPGLSQPLAGAEPAGAVVTRAEVAAVVSAWTGISLGQIGQDEASRLADLEARLGERVMGQASAIRQVASRVRMARTGLADPSRPAGVFLFLGPSGVGKTALAHTLAETLFDGSDRLIRLDMSEYGEANAGARLIGAPPGYVGHDREGQLTGPLRRQPYAVVLLDEVEKAHPEVFDLFLQLFDAGRLTDASGRTADGRNAIFIMTSNLLTGESARRRLGFGRDTAEQAPDLLAELRRFFRPELLNRVDEIVVFEPLGPAELVEIVGRRAADVRERLLAQHGIALAVSQEALELLARLAGDGQGGAREVNRVVARLLEEPMSRMLLAGEIGPGDQVTAAPDGNRLAIVSAPRAS